VRDKVDHDENYMCEKLCGEFFM